MVTAYELANIGYGGVAPLIPTSDGSTITYRYQTEGGNVVSGDTVKVYGTEQTNQWLANVASAGINAVNAVSSGITATRQQMIDAVVAYNNQLISQDQLNAVKASYAPTPTPTPTEPTTITPTYDPTHDGQGSLAVSPPTVVAAANVAISQPTYQQTTIPNYISNVSYFDAGRYAGDETPLVSQPMVNPIPVPSPLTNYGQVQYLRPIVEERQQALQAFNPMIVSGSFVGSDAQYVDYTQKVAEANVAVNQYNATVERYNTTPLPTIQHTGVMSQFSQNVYSNAGRVADVIAGWGAMADVGAQNIQSRLPEPISVLYGGAYQIGRGIVYNTPESVVRLAGMMPGGVEMIAKNPTLFPTLAVAGLGLQYEGLKEGITERPLQTVGEFAGMTAVAEGISGGMRSVPYRKMFGYSRTPPEPITPITREMIFGEGTLAPLENIVTNVKATPGIISDAISLDKMFGRGTSDSVSNVVSNIVETPGEIVRGIEPRKMFGTTPEKPEVNLQGEYFNKIRDDVQWKDYEGLKESNRWDIIDRKYPTPEPTPVIQPRTVNLETDLVARQPIDIPEEWYGKYTEIGYGGEYSRVGIGGERTSVVFPKDVVSRGPPTDAEMTDIYAKYNERQNSLYPYGQKSELFDRLSTPGEESVPIPRAKLPESTTEGRVTFRRDLTGEMNKRFETAQKLNDMEAKSGVTTAQQGQVLILKEESVLKPVEVTKTVEEPRVVNLESDLVKLERDYSVPERKIVFPYGTSSKLTDRIVTPNEEATVIPKGRLTIVNPTPQKTLVKKETENVLNPRWTKEIEKPTTKSDDRSGSGLVLVPKSRQRNSQNAVLMEPQNPLDMPTTVTEQESASVSKSKQNQKSDRKLVGITIMEPSQSLDSIYSSYQVTTPKQRQRSRITPESTTDLVSTGGLELVSVTTPKQKTKQNQRSIPLSKYDTNQIGEQVSIIEPTTEIIPKETTKSVLEESTAIIPKEKPSMKSPPTLDSSDAFGPFGMFIPAVVIKRKNRGGSQGGSFPERRRFGGVKSKRHTPWHPAALEYVTTEELTTGKLARHVRPKEVTQGLFKQYATTGRPIPTARQLKKRIGRSDIYG